MINVLNAIAQALHHGESVAVLTVVRALGSTPRHLPANMLVRADGSCVGSIGAEKLPDADDRILAHYEPGTETLAPMPLTITPSTFIVVATWGWDEPALRQIVNSPVAFIGLVVSARKASIIFRQLIAEGVALDVLARVRVPIGLDLGGESPAEIALSIMAEILMMQRNATGAPLAQLKGNAVLKLAAQDNRV